MSENKDLHVENAELNENEMSNEETALDINGDDNVAGTSHLNEELSNENEEFKAEDKLKNEAAEWKDKFIRLTAEFDNFKRRNAKERIELIQTAGKEVVVSMLDVLDDCERAEKQMNSSEDLNAIKEGISLVFNKLRKKITEQGVVALESIGKEFDANLHEAITEIPAPNEEMKGKVVDEIQKGYYMREKLIRFAKVVVGN